MASRSPMDFLQEQTFRQLQTLPGIGPGTAGDLIRAGVTSLDDLSRQDPRRLFERIVQAQGPRDARLLHAIADAVHHARTGVWQAATPW